MRDKAGYFELPIVENEDEKKKPKEPPKGKAVVELKMLRRVINYSGQGRDPVTNQIVNLDRSEAMRWETVYFEIGSTIFTLEHLERQRTNKGSIIVAIHGLKYLSRDGTEEAGVVHDRNELIAGINAMITPPESVEAIAKLSAAEGRIAQLEQERDAAIKAAASAGAKSKGKGKGKTAAEVPAPDAEAVQ